MCDFDFLMLRFTRKIVGECRVFKFLPRAYDRHFQRKPAGARGTVRQRANRSPALAINVQLPFRTEESDSATNS